MSVARLRRRAQRWLRTPVMRPSGNASDLPTSRNASGALNVSSYAPNARRLCRLGRAQASSSRGEKSFGAATRNAKRFTLGHFGIDTTRAIPRTLSSLLPRPPRTREQKEIDRSRDWLTDVRSNSGSTRRSLYGHS